MDWYWWVLIVAATALAWMMWDSPQAQLDRIIEAGERAREAREKVEGSGTGWVRIALENEADRLADRRGKLVSEFALSYNLDIETVSSLIDERRKETGKQ